MQRYKKKNQIIRVSLGILIKWLPARVEFDIVYEKASGALRLPMLYAPQRAEKV